MVAGGRGHAGRRPRGTGDRTVPLGGDPGRRPSTGGTAVPLIGAALGLVVAVLLGYLIYRGALKINLTKFFTWTGAFLIIVAAGVLAYGVHDLQEARFLPGLYNLAFDVSHVIPPDSWYGTLLKGIFNFSPATTKLEAIAWLAYVVPDHDLFLFTIRHRSKTSVPPGASRGGPCRKEMIMITASTRRGLAVAGLAARRCRCSRPAPTTPRSGTSGDDAADPRALTVQATDTACALSAADAPSGNLTFSRHQRRRAR